MKSIGFFVIFGLMAALLPMGVQAADLVKANNNQSLNLAASWTNNASPTSGTRMIWNNVVATPANCAGTNGATLSALGLKIVDPSADVSIANNSNVGLTLNASGIDMSEATRDLSILFTNSASLVQNVNADWNIPAGRTVSLTSKLYIQNQAGPGSVLTWRGGGTVRLNGDSSYLFDVAHLNMSTGTLALAGVTVYSSTPLILGQGSNTLATVSQTGGSNYLQCADATYGLLLGFWRGNSCGVYDLSGGLLSVSTNVYLGPDRAGVNATSQFTVRDAGTALVAGDIWMGGIKGTNCTATVTLKTGGTLSVRTIKVDSTVGTSTSKVEFDGGTLRPTISTTSFLAGLTKATLSTNGAVIDTNGRDIAIRQTLEDAAGQAGRLVKLGAGTLTLTNANTFSGAVLVSNGTLRVSANATLASTNWVISAGATNKFDSAVTLAGKSVTIDAGGVGTPGLLDVTGNLTLGGKLTVVNRGDRQKIAQCTGTLSGAFAETSLPGSCVLRTVNGNELWVVHLTGTSISVR